MELNKTKEVDFIEEIYVSKIKQYNSHIAKDWLETAYKLGINVVEETYNHSNPEIAEDKLFFSWVARESIELLLNKPVVIKNYKANK